MPIDRFNLRPGDWDVPPERWETENPVFLNLWLWSLEYVRPNVCRILGHVVTHYSTLEEYKSVRHCARCHRLIDVGQGTTKAGPVRGCHKVR